MTRGAGGTKRQVHKAINFYSILFQSLWNRKEQTKIAQNSTRPSEAVAIYGKLEQLEKINSPLFIYVLGRKEYSAAGLLLQEHLPWAGYVYTRRITNPLACNYGNACLVKPKRVTGKCGCGERTGHCFIPRNDADKRKEHYTDQQKWQYHLLPLLVTILGINMSIALVIVSFFFLPPTVIAKPVH